MDVYPAIDIRGGRTVHARDPVEEARALVSAGARWLHVVDMDQAVRTGRHNMQCVWEIAEIEGVAVQLGGNLTDPDEVRRGLDAGVDRVVFGTAAGLDPAMMEKLLAVAGEGRSAVAIDVREGRVALRGMTDAVAETPIELARQAHGLGIATVLYRDLERDGLLMGADVEGAARLREEARLAVIVAGGVAELDEVRRAGERGLAGIVVGRALHEGRFTLQQALACCGSSS
ncbi:MAG: HisA/HisF-related TIM barrel protein [Gemmatimonadales bacterium]